MTFGRERSVRPLTPRDISGVWGTLLLPLDTSGSIAWASLEHQTDTLVASGVHGLYAHGTAGEFHTLTTAEFDRVNALLAERCERVGLPFQIGATHAYAHETLDRVARAKQYSPGALQVILPDWLPVSAPECVDYLERVAEAAAPLPLVLYNPPHAKTHVSPEFLSELLDRLPTLVGVKMAGGDQDWYSHMGQAVHHPGKLRCSVFVAGHHLATGMRQGAHGSYSNVAAMSPRGAVAWYELMQHDPETALDVETRLLRFFEGHILPLQKAGFSNPALDKFLAAIGGWSDAGLHIRWPGRSVPTEALPAARRDAHALIPELFGA